MSTQNKAVLPAFAIIDSSQMVEICVTEDEARRKALRSSNDSRQSYAVVQVLGYARCPEAPAEWIPANGVAEETKVVPVKQQTSSSPPSLPTQTARQAQPSLSSVHAIPPQASNRVKPKYPSIRGVDFPSFVDIVATDGPDGPPTKEQIEDAETEIKRLGGSLNKTVKSWTGLEADRINSAAMSSVVTILKGWVK